MPPHPRFDLSAARRGVAAPGIHRLGADLATPSLAASVRLSIWAAAFFNFFVALTSDLFLHGFAINVLHVSDLQLSLLVSLPAAAGFVQLATPYLIHWAGSRKRAVFGSITLAALLWLLIPLLALLSAHGPSQHAILALIGGLCLVQVARSFTGVAALSWISDLVPSAGRGTYFGVRQRFVMVVTLAVTLSGGWLLDHAGAGPVGYWIVFGAAVAFALVSAAVYRRMVEPTADPATTRIHDWHALLTPLGDPSFRRFLVFSAVWQFGMSFAGAFWNLFMLEELHLSLGFMAFLAVVQSVSGILTSGYWGRVVDRVGAKPVMVANYFGKAIFAALWLFATPASYVYLALIRLFGVCDAGIQVSNSTLLLKLSPPGNNTGYIGAQAAVIGLIGALSPLLGGLLAPSLHGVALHMPWGTMHYLHVLIFVSFALRLVSLLWLKCVPEPGERSLRAAIPAMWAEARKRG